MSVKHVSTDFKGDPNIGFHAVLTDAYAVVAPLFKRTEEMEVDRMAETTVSNTDFIGLFAAGNCRGIVLPDIVKEHELGRLEEKDINYLVLDSDNTALGNLVLVNDKGCLVGEPLAGYKDELSEFFGVPVTVGTVAGLDVVGSAGFVTNKGVLLHREASERELEKAEEALGVEGDIGTVNFGSPYVGAGLVANSDVLFTGKNTTGPENARIDKALGFLD